MSRVDQVIVSKSHVVLNPIVDVLVPPQLLELEQFHYLLCLDQFVAFAESQLFDCGQYLLRRLGDVSDAPETEVLESIHHAELVWTLCKAHHGSSEV